MFMILIVMPPTKTNVCKFTSLPTHWCDLYGGTQLFDLDNNKQALWRNKLNTVSQAGAAQL